uniref:PRA1 family protein n=1 Tax=Parascaris univalens TaxID=6257 RepID=A0A914ZZB1_PARUN
MPRTLCDRGIRSSQPTLLRVFSLKHRSAMDVNWKLCYDVEVPPVRGFSEFVLDRSHLEMPPFRDLPKWNARILSNLLYFQSNYFVVVFLFAAVWSSLHATDTVIGLSAVVVLGAVVSLSLSRHPALAEMRREHPLATLGAFVIASYYFIYTLSSVIVVLFTLAVPLLLVLLHASVRLRDLKTKINRINLKKTLMARLLELFGVDFKTFWVS